MAGEKVDLDRMVRLIACAAVLAPDDDDRLNRIYRFYSEKFHVPLPEVPFLDLAHVLRTYWEVQYENLEPQDLWQERCDLLETPEEHKRRVLAEEAEEAERFQFAREVELEEAERQKRLAAKARKEASAAAELRKQQGPGKVLVGDPSDLPHPDLLLPEERPAPPAPPKVTSQLPPDFKFEFSDEPLDLDELELSNAQNPPDAKR